MTEDVAELIEEARDVVNSPTHRTHLVWMIDRLATALDGLSAQEWSEEEIERAHDTYTLVRFGIHRSPLASLQPDDRAEAITAMLAALRTLPRTQAHQQPTLMEQADQELAAKRVARARAGEWSTLPRLSAQAELLSALRPFAFLNDLNKFNSVDGGCTQALIEDSDVQQVRRLLTAVDDRAGGVSSLNKLEARPLASLSAQAEGGETITVRDSDAVCSTCRWKGAHAPNCPRKDEPWPTFEMESPSLPVGGSERDSSDE